MVSERFRKICPAIEIEYSNIVVCRQSINHERSVTWLDEGQNFSYRDVYESTDFPTPAKTTLAAGHIEDLQGKLTCAM